MEQYLDGRSAAAAGGVSRVCALCETRAAVVFCFADNAALCDTCNTEIHASTFQQAHERVPLSALTAEQLPEDSQVGPMRGVSIQGRSLVSPISRRYLLRSCHHLPRLMLCSANYCPFVALKCFIWVQPSSG